ncbi:MAG: calcium-binding protein [Planctomycetia bacterium]|nr:calcium-binding protein [Planctomycetia bacterium]
MVLPRGSESWRRLSRFRRQTQVKPMAAEVLEPRCMMTEGLGVGLPTPPLTDAAPLTGDVVIAPDQWDDIGLTLQQVGDLLHVFHTDTQTDAITPLLPSQITSLSVIGRDNAADVLTIDFSFGWSLPTSILHFDGGTGPVKDQLQLVNAANQTEWIWNEMMYRPTMRSSGEIGGGFEFLRTPTQHARCWVAFDYREVELVQDSLISVRANSMIGGMRNLQFGSESNEITVDWPYEIGVRQISDSVTGTTIQFAKRCLFDFLSLDVGDGNDRILVRDTSESTPGQDISVEPFGWELWVLGSSGDDFVTISSMRGAHVFGDAGNDSLIGGPGDDDIQAGDGNDVVHGQSGSDFVGGGEGNDFLEGGDGDDVLAPGLGRDSVDGGFGKDCVRGSGVKLTLSKDRITDSGIDASLANIETAILNASENYGQGHIGSRLDASGFDGPVTLRGESWNDTLIGGRFDDLLTDYDGGDDLLQGGGGNDTLDGGGGANTLWAGNGADKLVKRSRRDVLHWSNPSAAEASSSETMTIVVSLTSNNFSNVSNDTSDVLDDQSVVSIDDGDSWLSAPPGDVLLIGQGIVTVEIEDREWAEFDTFSSDSAFGELIDYESESGGDLAASGDINSADMGEGLELDSAMRDELVVSVAEPLLSDEQF